MNLRAESNAGACESGTLCSPGLLCIVVHVKTILCFGDSNTWGYNPHRCGRYEPEVRWTGVLQTLLGPDYRIIEEGLNGRTTVWDDPAAPVPRSGKLVLPVCLETHMPLDLVIIMLGTNDLKIRFSAPAADIAGSAGLLPDIVLHSRAGRDGSPPLSLLVCPPPIGDEPAFDGTFGMAREKSKQLAAFFQRETEMREGCCFLNAADYIETSSVDGVHLDEEGHSMLGMALAKRVGMIL